MSQPLKAPRPWLGSSPILSRTGRPSAANWPALRPCPCRIQALQAVPLLRIDDDDRVLPVDRHTLRSLLSGRDGRLGITGHCPLQGPAICTRRARGAAERGMLKSGHAFLFRSKASSTPRPDPGMKRSSGGLDFDARRRQMHVWETALEPRSRHQHRRPAAAGEAAAAQDRLRLHRGGPRGRARARPQRERVLGLRSGAALRRRCDGTRSEHHAVRAHLLRADRHRAHGARRPVPAGRRPDARHRCQGGQRALHHVWRRAPD